MSHVYTVVFINDLNSWIFVAFTKAVQFFDDWYQSEEPLPEFKRPFFKGFAARIVWFRGRATRTIEIALNSSIPRAVKRRIEFRIYH